MLVRYSAVNQQLLNSFGTEALMLKKELRRLKVKQRHSLTLLRIQPKFRRDTRPWQHQQRNRFFFFCPRLLHIEERKKSGFLDLSKKLLLEAQTYGYCCQLTKK